MTLRLSRKFGPWILHHAFEFKWLYLGAFLCLYILQKLQVELPERIRLLTEMISKREAVGNFIWIFLGLALGIFIFRTLSRLLFFYPARVQQKLLRMELLGLLESTPPARYSQVSQGQIFQILFDDINNLRAFVGFGLLQIGNLIITAWVLIPKFNQSDAHLWPAFIPLFISVIFFSIMTMINQKFYKRMMDKKGEVQQYIIESYEAKQTIKNFHRENSFISRFKHLSGEELKLFFKTSIGYAFTGPYVKLGLGLSLIWGGLLIKQKGGSASDLVYFSGFLYLFLEPVMFLSWVAVVVSQGLAAWKRVSELFLNLNQKSENETKFEEHKFYCDEKMITFEQPFWGQTINLTFVREKWSVLCGETGCGKSYLLERMATILKARDFRVSLVTQEPYLFNGTIYENIFLGREANDVDMAQAKLLLGIFQMEGLASTLDDVLALEVGENGKRLSGGQSKRLALIRSLMSGADFFIWDDPFSSVDIILEKKILNLLRDNSLWQKRTFIISAHRLTTVRLVDELILLGKDHGIRGQFSFENGLKDPNVVAFFREQLVEVSLA